MARARAEHTVNCTVLFATAALLANSASNHLQSILLPIRTVATAVKPTCQFTVQLLHAIEILISNLFSYVSDFQFYTLFKVAHTAVPAQGRFGHCSTTNCTDDILEWRYPYRGSDSME